MNVINDPNRTAASSWANALSQGLGAGLNDLISAQVNKLKQKSLASAYEKSGYSKADANLLSRFEPEVQAKMWEKLQPQAQQSANQTVQEQQQPTSAIEAMQNASEPTAMAPQGTNAMPSLEALKAMQPQVMSGYQRFPGLNPLAGMMPQQPQQQGMSPSQGPTPILQNAMQNQQASLQNAMQNQQAPQQQMQQPQQLTTAQRLSMPTTNPMLEERKRHNQFTEAATLRKEARPIIKEIATAKAENEKTLAVLDKQESLSESNKTNSPEWMSGLKMFGLDDIPALTKPGTQEYKALQANFFTNLKKYFGSRPTTFEVKAYLDKLATVYNTKEGRKQMIYDQRKMIQADQVVNDAREQVIEANGGVPPADLEFKAYKLAQPKVDRIWGEFKKGMGIEKLPPPSQLDPAEFKGRYIKNPKTGERQYSDGKDWSVVK